MDDREAALREKLDRLLREAAEVSVELERAEGNWEKVPHYSKIELRAHELGKRLSREAQRRRMSEVAADAAPSATCPACGFRCETPPKKRGVKSIDGDVELQEPRGECPRCRRAFFPSAGTDGL
jgi:DNA repair exonuclease SbcCD ATPase subunit